MIKLADDTMCNAKRCQAPVQALHGDRSSSQHWSLYRIHLRINRSFRVKYTALYGRNSIPRQDSLAPSYLQPVSLSYRQRLQMETILATIFSLISRRFLRYLASKLRSSLWRGLWVGKITSYLQWYAWAALVFADANLRNRRPWESSPQLLGP